MFDSLKNLLGMSNSLENALNKSGWTPNRKISFPDDTLMHPAAKSFLENYGNLSIRRTNIVGIDWFDFVWQRAMKAYYQGIINDFSQLLGRPLYVVGECDCGHTTILIDDLGRFFRDCDTVLHPLAITTSQMLYNLWNGPNYDYSNLEEIPPLDRKVFWNGDDISLGKQ